MNTGVMVLAFIALVALGFAAVPWMIRLFVYLQRRFGRGQHWLLDWIDHNQRRLTWGVWAMYSLGLLLALPGMIKDDFFAPAELGEAQPILAAGAQPPLDHQLRHAQRIVLAFTRVAGEDVAYEVTSVWKTQGDMLTPGTVLKPDIASFRLLGYEPQDGQSVVLLFTELQALFELLPVSDYHVVYAPQDPAVRETLDLDELQQRALGAV
jgi:hypothetical protein